MMHKSVVQLFFALLIVVCETNAHSANIGTVFSFKDEADLHSQAMKLIDATAQSRAKRGAPTLSRTRRQAADRTNHSVEDGHDYYTKRISVNHPRTKFYTSEFDRMFSTYPVGSHDRMNDAHNLAWIVPIKFAFPFYGHVQNQVVITTAGYLYINEVTHRYLGFAQYIAPLKANFDTHHPISRIKMVDAEDSLWVRWENMQLNEKREFGNFSFQCGLYKNGSIVFDYISLPRRVGELRKFTNYSVAVGLSDAFYNDTRISSTAIRRLIVKYHSIDVDISMITNETVVEFTHLTTCNQLKSCRSCLDPARAKNFNCSWCHELGACSSGVDRRWQEWTSNSCHIKKGPCESTSTSTSTVTSITTANPKAPTPQAIRDCARDGRDCRPPLGIAAVMGILLLAVLVLGSVGSCIAFVVFAHRNPNSRAGMWLIENRPSRLRERLSNVRFFKSSGDGASGGDAYKVDISNTYDNMSA